MTRSLDELRDAQARLSNLRRVQGGGSVAPTSSPSPQPRPGPSPALQNATQVAEPVNVAQPAPLRPVQTGVDPTSGEMTAPPQTILGPEAVRQPAFIQAVEDFVVNNSEFMPGAAYLLGDQITGGALNQTVTQARQGVQSGTEAFSLTALDRTSQGLLDTATAGQAQVQAIAAGATSEEALASGEAAADQLNRDLDLARETYRWQTLGGDITGSLIGGSPYIRGANMIVRPSTMRNLGTGARAASNSPTGRAVVDYFAVPGIAASGEAMVYGLNSDFTVDEIGADMGSAAAFGAIGGSLFGIGAGFVRGLRGSTTGDLNIRMGEELFTAISRAEAAKGRSITIEQAVDMVKNRGQDQVLTDLFPDLTPRLRQLIGSNDPAVQDRAIDLLRTRSSMDSYRDRVLQVVNDTGVPRSPQRQNDYLNREQSALSSQYTTVLNDMDSTNLPIHRSTVLNTLTGPMNSNLPTHADDVRLVNEAVQAVVGDAGRITHSQLNEIRKNLQNQVYQRIRGNNSGANTNSLPISNLRNATQLISAHLGNANPRFAELQRTYGDIQDARNAYEYGRQIITSGAFDSADAQVFMQGNINPLVAEAFTEGARFSVAQYAARASDPARALTEARLDDLAAIIGDDAVETMRQNVQEVVNSEATRNALRNPDANVERGVPTAARAADLMMGMRAAQGGGGGLLPILAARRFLGGATGSMDVAPTNREVAALRQGGAEAFLTEGGSQAGNIVTDLLLGNNRGPEALLRAARDQANAGAVPRAATALGSTQALRGDQEGGPTQPITDFAMDETRAFLERFGINQ